MGDYYGSYLGGYGDFPKLGVPVVESPEGLQNLGVPIGALYSGKLHTVFPSGA